MSTRKLFCASLALALTPLGCLPDDTRDPPGQLEVTLSADSSLRTGIPSTEDGWAIAYSRFLLVLGDADLSGDDCDAYSESHYNRIFELSHESPQRVSLLYGLGRCQFGFRIAAPAWDSLLGDGVTTDDETWLRTPGSDAHATDAGVSIRVQGLASKLGVQKSFDWSFRRFISYEDCTLPEDATLGGGVLLRGNESSQVDIVVRGDALFGNAAVEPAAPARFEPFRAADDEHGDANGEITLDELQASPLPPGASAGAMIQSLGDRVYLQMLPQLAKFQGTGTCQARSSSERPDFRGP
jgi:hypothetical protein